MQTSQQIKIIDNFRISVSINSQNMQQLGNKQQKHPPQYSISYKTLYALVIILLLIWILCYISENKIKQIKKQQLLDRLPNKNISNKQLKQTISRYYHISAGVDNKLEQIKEDNKISNNSSGNMESKVRFCVLVNHKIGNQNWVGSILSIITQTHPQTKIIYINNKRGTKQLHKYLQNNAILFNWIKLQSVQQNNNVTFISFISHADKCQGYDYVLLMDDQQILVNQRVFQELGDIVVKWRREGQKGEFLYGGMAVRENSFKQIKLGNSFPYPLNILQNQQYTKYPFIINGLILFTPALHKKLTYTLTKNKKGQLFKRILKPAVILQMLKKSQGKVKYINKILILTNQPQLQEFIMPDYLVKKQLQELYTKIQ